MNTSNSSEPLNRTDFDDLSRRTQSSNASREDFDRLFEAVFDLPEWLFIARGESPAINPYIASKQGVADGQQMVRAFTDGERLHRFAVENGLLDTDGQALMLAIPTAKVIDYLEQFEAYGVYGVWFNSDLQSDGFFTPLKQLRIIKEHLERNQVSAETTEARRQQDSLADLGMSQTVSGDLDLNLVINKVGAVRFDSVIGEFYEAVVQAATEFQGTGDFVSLLAFDPSGISQMTENIVQNEHGTYLRARNFQYLNPKNGVNIGVISLHSNHLRHVGSNAEMTISIELCKNLDNHTAVLYHRFEGPKAAVLGLSARFEPVLERSDYEPVS